MSVMGIRGCIVTEVEDDNGRLNFDGKAAKN